MVRGNPFALEIQPYSGDVMTAHRRSIAERGECFQRRLFVCLFVCQHDNFRTIKRRMMKLGG